MSGSWKVERSILVVCLFILMVNCDRIPGKKSDEPVRIDFTATHSDTIPRDTADSIPPVHLAVAAMTSPKETLMYYEELVHYISKKLGRPVKIEQNKTYREVNNQLQQQHIDAAFICSGAFVEAQQRFPIEIIAIPVIEGQQVYHAYVIVHQSSPIRRFEELQGKSFAFTDPLSNTGYFYPLKRIKELHSTPSDFFSKTIFTHGHDFSIQAVARQIVDGASVDGLIFDYLKKFDPEKVKNLRIIEVSEDFGMPPVVVHRNLNPELKNALRKILLNMHRDPEGKKILTRLMIDRFLPGNPSNYQTVASNLNFVIP